MSLDIWFSEDIRNALLAANEASAATAAVITEVDTTDLLAVSLRAYRQGYKAALVTVALAFGLAPQTLEGKEVRNDGELHGPGEPVAGPASGPALSSHGEFVATIADHDASGPTGPGVGAGAKPGQKRGDPRTTRNDTTSVNE